MRPTHAPGKQSSQSLVGAKADCVTERVNHSRLCYKCSEWLPRSLRSLRSSRQKDVVSTKTPVRQPKLGWRIAAVLTHVPSTQLALRGMGTLKGGGDCMKGMANAIPLFYTVAAPHHFIVVSHERISAGCMRVAVRVCCK